MIQSFKVTYQHLINHKLLYLRLLYMLLLLYGTHPLVLFVDVCQAYKHHSEQDIKNGRTRISKILLHLKSNKNSNTNDQNQLLQSSSN